MIYIGKGQSMETPDASEVWSYADALDTVLCNHEFYVDEDDPNAADEVDELIGNLEKARAFLYDLYNKMKEAG